MSSYTEFENKVVFHPGYYIKEYMEINEFTEEEFAQKLDLPTETLILITNGEYRISQNIAERLALLSGTSKSYWENLQKTYDDQIMTYRLKLR